jgi:membrane fusion protein (multidrug efflux system)
METAQMELDREEAEERPGYRRYFEKKYVIPAALLILILAVLVWLHYRGRESTDDAQIDGHIVSVSARVSGTIASVNVKDNQYVQTGTLVVQIDPSDYRIAVDRAQADLEQARADAAAAQHEVAISNTTTESSLNSAEARLRASKAEALAAQNQVTAAQARARAAEANNAKASKDLERLKSLVAKDEISQRDYDAAVANADSARASLDSANAAVVEAQEHVNQMQSTVAQMRAELNSANTVPNRQALKEAQASSANAKVQQMQAVLDQAKLNLQYTQVRAPISGWVSKKGTEAGQVVQAGQPLLAVVPLSDIWVTANFKETQLKEMAPGQPAIISVDTYGSREYKGHVDSIAPATGAKFSFLPPENATGNYVKVVQRIPVKILFEKGQDPNHQLRPGMSVEATVITK